jgi:hypothetical protein
MNDADLAALVQGMHALANAASELKDDPTWDRETIAQQEPARVS